MGDGPKLNLREIHWLASFPKSGNTWVRMLYQAHVYKHLDINANLRLTYSDALPHNYQAVSTQPLEKMCKEHVALLRGAALINVISERPNQPLIVKTHNANIDINTCTLIPKELTVSSVLIVRDPRDVALSYANYLNRDLDEVIGMMENETHCLGTYNMVPQFPSSWSLFNYSWKVRGDPLIVRYEDLCEDTEHWFKQVLESWGVDAQGAGKAVDLARLENMKKQETDQGFVENLGTSAFFNRGGSYWKDELTTKQASRIEEKHGEMMGEFGYL